MPSRELYRQDFTITSDRPAFDAYCRRPWQRGRARNRLRRHCCFDRAREPLFEIDDADPFRTDADPQHLREHLLRLTDPRLSLLFPKVSLGTRDILGNDTFYCVSLRGSANLQDLMRPVVGVDGHRDLRIP